MTQKFTNNSGISIPLAVWLARDEYDYDDRTNVISTTTLLKSTRQIVLESRLKPSEVNLPDISGRLASRIGTSLHNSIELSWTENAHQALTDLGYPKRVVDCVKVNPDPSEVDEDTIPMYLEKRTEKQVGKWIVSGQFDIIFDGQVQDVKSTGTFAYMTGSNDDKYCMQGSIYRWLNPELITQDHMAVQFIFKDWSKNQAMSNPKYPQLPVLEHLIELKSVGEVETFINQKLWEIETNWEKPESELPYCNDKELWRSNPSWKYFSKPDAKRASKNFDSESEAMLHLGQKGKGEVREVKSEPTACKYCSAFAMCSQGQSYVNSGELKV